MSEKELALYQRVGFSLPEDLAPNMGVFYGLPMNEYQKILAMSKSTLFSAKRSAKYFLYKLNERLEEDPADAAAHFTLGRAIHTSCLEPQLFDSSYAVAPAVNKRTNDGKATLAKFAAEAAKEGKEVLEASQYEQVMGMGQAVQNHKMSQEILAGGEAEVSMVAFDDEFSCYKKCRVDWLVDNSIFVDLKSVGRLADQDSVIKHIFDLGYYVQAGMYTGIGSTVLRRKITDFVFIFVETSPPHQIGIYRVGPVMMEAGIKMYRHLMERVHTSFARNEWANYNNDKIVELELKPWMHQQLYNEF